MKIDKRHEWRETERRLSMLADYASKLATWAETAADLLQQLATRAGAYADAKERTETRTDTH